VGKSSKYPFQFTLPRTLPSTFTSTTGNLLYFIIAKITRTGTGPLSVIVARLPFAFNGELDLNNHDGAMKEISVNKEKIMYGLIRTSGRIGFKLDVPRTGFVPGENIPVTVEMRNESKKIVQKTTLELLQTVTYIVKRKSRTNLKIIRLVEGPSVQKGGSELWKCLLAIPEVPPSGLGGTGCTILKCDYSLEVRLIILISVLFLMYWLH